VNPLLFLYVARNAQYGRFARASAAAYKRQSYLVTHDQTDGRPLFRI